MNIFAYFERLLEPTAKVVETPPPDGLVAFYWHFVRQVRWLMVGLFVSGMITALLDTTVPAFIGKLVGLLTGPGAEGRLEASWPLLAAMAVAVLVLRPAANFLQGLISAQTLNSSLTNLVRWQSYWHVTRQSWTFFQNDYAGRIANRIVQVGPALRESVVSCANAVWYLLIYGTSAIWLLGSNDPRLTLPVLGWFATYVVALWYFVPRMRERSKSASEVRSMMVGRVVDSYTNILTVKLFALPRDEDNFVKDSVDQHTRAFRHQSRLITGFGATLNILNALLITATGAVAVWLWHDGRIAVGAVATALPLTWQLANMSNWVAGNVTGIFDNVGQVQDAMRSITVARGMVDAPDAKALEVDKGEIRFEDVRFGYGTERGVLHGVDLVVHPGERVGLIGHSGAGKTTLVNLLLRLYDLESGRILVDGQDVRQVTQESLRGHIAMVTQDTSLLHRSIRENVMYGRPSATEAELIAATKQAQAFDFIQGLEDYQGNRGFEAQVGERGVKLSAGQRQRVAIARVILKDAPILLLDEATSALDSEVEAAIQEQLDGLMQGRTVIAIAHRLSTIAKMDRLIVLEHGRIAETGTHAELLARGGIYARLWQRQSGGFVEVDEPSTLDSANAAG